LVRTARKDELFRAVDYGGGSVERFLRRLWARGCVKEVVEGGGQVGVRHPDGALSLVVFAGQEGGLAQEFLEEGGGDAFGALDDGVQPGQVEHKVALVEPDQLAAGAGVGPGKFGGQVDAARAGGQRGLQQVGPVGEFR
jgi:hypothetical protein